MNNNIVLELRQKDTNSVVANGEYESFLASDILIENGDMVMLKTAFIDTKKEATINIENDLVLKLQYCVYFRDWLEQMTYKKEYYDASNNNIFIPANNINNAYKCGQVYKGQKFIPYYQQILGTEPFQIVNYVQYTALYGQWQPFSETMPVVYQYVDVLSGELMTIHKTIPSQPQNTVYKDDLGLVVKGGSFQIISPSIFDMKEEYQWQFDSVNLSQVTNNVFSPYIFTKQFTLPAGSYSPQDISTYISEQMTKNSINFTSSLYSTDSCVKGARDFIPGKPYPYGTNVIGTIPASGTFWFSDDMTTRFQFTYDSNLTTLPNYIIGATQTALEYDADSDRFSWTYLHSPMYDATKGDNISSRYINIGNLTLNPQGSPNPFTITNNYLEVTDNGGIFFTGLSAIDTATGQNFDFWSGILGFDLSNLCASPRTPYVTQSTPVPTTYFGLEGTFTSFIVDPNNNVTTGFGGIDNVILKTPNTFYVQQVLNPPEITGSNIMEQGAPLCSTIQDTTALNASVSLQELLDNFSHYLIDAELHFSNAYIGSSRFKSIQGIVSRYYQFGNYCVGGSDGAIQYVHMGSPIILKSVKIRIMNSDKKNDANLGSDNTVIFQIIKATPSAPSKKSNSSS